MTLQCLCTEVLYCDLRCFQKDLKSHKLKCEADIGSKEKFLKNLESVSVLLTAKPEESKLPPV